MLNSFLPWHNETLLPQIQYMILPPFPPCTFSSKSITFNYPGLLEKQGISVIFHICVNSWRKKTSLKEAYYERDYAFQGSRKS